MSEVTKQEIGRVLRHLLQRAGQKGPASPDVIARELRVRTQLCALASRADNTEWTVLRVVVCVGKPSLVAALFSQAAPQVLAEGTWQEDVYVIHSGLNIPVDHTFVVEVED